MAKSFYPHILREKVFPETTSLESILLLYYSHMVWQMHREYEDRSHYYDALIVSHARAEKTKKGYHSKKDCQLIHMVDLTTLPAKKANEFLHILQRTRRHSAIVDQIFNGHHFKVTIPNRDEPYSNEAITMMRRRILQLNIEIEIEIVDRSETFLENYEEVKISNASASDNKETLKVIVTEVLGSGMFYIQTLGDERVKFVRQQLVSLDVKDTSKTSEVKDQLETSKDESLVATLEHGDRQGCTNGGNDDGMASGESQGGAL
uniref:Uncharacterized protein n=1 Tax=Leersia perrieri TaxID=77586 RepID=A0A0D9VDR9_9ORYZ